MNRSGITSRYLKGLEMLDDMRVVPPSPEQIRLAAYQLASQADNADHLRHALAALNITREDMQ